LVRHGLKMLSDSRWAGLRALVEAAGLAGQPIRAGQVGFILAPRLNAAGRIGDANDGLRLLLSDDPVEAGALARQLETLNARRQEMDQRILEEAIDMAAKTIKPEDCALVLASDDWHPGVIGIVASRLGEGYGRPPFPIGWAKAHGEGGGQGHWEGVGTEHRGVRSPRRAPSGGRLSRAVRRTHDGGGAHHQTRAIR